MLRFHLFFFSFIGAGLLRSFHGHSCPSVMIICIQPQTWGVSGRGRGRGNGASLFLPKSKTEACKKFAIQVVCTLICLQKPWVMMFHFRSMTPLNIPCSVSCSLIGCRLLPMSFPVKPHFTLQDCESPTGQDISNAKYSTGISNALLDHVFDNARYTIVTHVNEHRFASDFGHFSAISTKLSVIENQG